jgi:hypothetical protein
MPRVSLQCVAWLVGFLGCAGSEWAHAQEEGVQKLQANGVEARLHVEPTRTTAAGRIVAEVGVTGPSSITVEIRPPAHQPMGQLSVVSATSRGPVMLRPGVMEYGLRVVFTPFLGGAFEVPAFTIAYRSTNIAGELVTKPVPVLVESVIDGDASVAMPAGILAIDETPMDRFWLRFKWLAVAVVVAGAGWLVLRSRRRATASPPRHLGPYEAALAALEAGAAASAASLERVIESLRSSVPEPLPEGLRDSYLWIRFGSPTATEIEQFSKSLKYYLREQSHPSPHEAV